jgi:hypothetical protein
MERAGQPSTASKAVERYVDPGMHQLYRVPAGERAHDASRSPARVTIANRNLHSKRGCYLTIPAP